MHRMAMQYSNNIMHIEYNIVSTIKFEYEKIVVKNFSSTTQEDFTMNNFLMKISNNEFFYNYGR